MADYCTTYTKYFCSCHLLPPHLDDLFFNTTILELTLFSSFLSVFFLQGCTVPRLCMTYSNDLL
jgi:hypothetical protein